MSEEDLVLRDDKGKPLELFPHRAGTVIWTGTPRLADYWAKNSSNTADIIWADWPWYMEDE